MFKKLLAGTAMFALLLSSNAFAAVDIVGSGSSTGSYVDNFKVTPTTFNPTKGESATISYTTGQSLSLYTYVINSDYEIVATFLNYNTLPAGNVTHSFYGRSGNTAGGSVLPNGKYVAKVFAAKDSSIVDYELAEFTITSGSTTPTNGGGTGGGYSDGVIEDFTIDPSGTFDPNEEELVIEFALEEEVDELMVIAKKGSKEIELFEENNADDTDYEVTWDGTDEDGDYVSAGAWEIVVTADNDKVSKSVNVVFGAPEISDAFVTKEAFDPSEEEKVSLVFRVEDDSVVTVEILEGTKRETTLLDEEEVEGDSWYAVEWDGTDDDGDEVDFDDNWKFRLIVENENQNDGKDIQTIDIDVKEDEVSSKKANITNDFIKPIIFDEDKSSSFTVSYCTDDKAEITLSIHEGKGGSGKEVVELLDEVSQAKGCHTVKWNAEDKKGKELKDGIYSYKIVSKTTGSNKDTEIGRFVIGETEGKETKKDTKKPFEPKEIDFVDGEEGTCKFYYSDLGNIYDENELCAAIGWATEKGIFNGYPDGSFKPYADINRAEVLKAVFIAFNVKVFPADDDANDTAGFVDVNPSAWYMTYVKTAKFYSMLDGYNSSQGKQARLENNINRVELLKFVLEASRSFTGYEFVTGENNYADVSESNAAWFYQYASAAYQYDLFDGYNVGNDVYLKPTQSVERGEVALLLFRMYKAGLLD